MSSSAHIPVSFAVEGPTDAAVVRRLAAHVDVQVHLVLTANGKNSVLEKLKGLDRAARGQPWWVLVDLDQDAPCAGNFVQRHLPHPAPHMRFRVAVRTVEAWLLADRPGFARFFGVPLTRLPTAPEELPDPKQVVVNLARLSERRDVREEVPPRPGSGKKTGALYSSKLIEFAMRHWNIEAARKTSKSLDRAVLRLAELRS